MDIFTMNQIIDSINFTLESLGCYERSVETLSVERVLNRTLDLIQKNEIDDVISILNKDLEGHRRFIRLDSNVEYHTYAKKTIEDMLYLLKRVTTGQKQYMMTGVRVGDNAHRVKMWVVSEEDKIRIELAGSKVEGAHETYVKVEFLPW